MIKQKTAIHLASLSLFCLLGSLNSVEASVGDFNGDGFVDLAVGVSNESIGGIPGAGAVNVIYGSPFGLAATTPTAPIANQLWHQDTPDIEGFPNAGDNFGYSLSAGDFNGDGFTDLAVGTPNESIGGISGVGVVNVIYGSPSGLSTTAIIPDQMWHQNTLTGSNEAGDKFGSALAAGDFDGNGFADLAVGVPSEDLGVSGSNVVDAGAVNIIYGSSSGLTATGNNLWYQGILSGSAETGDKFGSALSAGDFNGSGHADLAVGVPSEDLGVSGVNVVDAGAVNIIYGSSSGLTATGNNLWHQGILSGSAETGDKFGSALSAGDFNGSGHADLAVGVPDEDLGVSGVNVVDAGLVNIIYGSFSGLTATGNNLWHQNMLASGVRTGEKFGASLSAGDFNGSGHVDLAVGVPVDTVGVSGIIIDNAGAVNIIYGSSSGLTTTGNKWWNQSILSGSAQTGDKFGYALSAGDFNGSGHADLAIGVPEENIGAISDAGAVNVIYGSSSGLTATGNNLWHQGMLSGSAEAGDKFGSSISQ